MTTPPNAPPIDELTAARLRRFIVGRIGAGPGNTLHDSALAVEFFCAELDRALTRLATLEAKEAERSRGDGDGR